MSSGLSLKRSFTNSKKLHKEIHPRNFLPVSNFWQVDSSVFLCNFPSFSSSSTLFILFFSALCYVPLFICVPSIKPSNPINSNNTPFLIHLWFINKNRAGLLSHQADLFSWQGLLHNFENEYIFFCNNRGYYCIHYIFLTYHSYWQMNGLQPSLARSEGNK